MTSEDRNPIENYAGTLGGVATFCMNRLDYWHVHSNVPGEFGKGMITGKKMAYAEILRIITGRWLDRQTEREIREIIKMVCR